MTQRSDTGRFQLVPLVGPRSLPRTKSALAKAYGVSVKTFRRWLIPIESELKKAGCQQHTRMLTPKAVLIVVRHLNPPEGFD